MKALRLPLVMLACASANGSIIAHWTFDEDGGSIAADRVGGFDGALTGGAAFAPGGVSGNCIGLDEATASLVNAGTSFPGFIQADFSVAVWVKTTTTATDSLIVGKHEGGTLNGYL